MVAGRDLNIRTERVVRKTVVQTDPGGKHISNTTARKIQDLVKDYKLAGQLAGKRPLAFAILVGDSYLAPERWLEKRVIPLEFADANAVAKFLALVCQQAACRMAS